MAQGDSSDGVSESDVEFLKCLRNSIDQARKLLELVCEREKMKKNWVCGSVSLSCVCSVLFTFVW